MYKYDNIKNDKLDDCIDHKRYTQRFNDNWSSVVVKNTIFKIMLNMSTQIIKNDKLEKDILNFFAFSDIKDLKIEINFDIDYFVNDRYLTNEEYKIAIDTELERVLDKKLIELKELKRKEQKAYFAKKRAIEKSLQKKEKIYEKN